MLGHGAIPGNSLSRPLGTGSQLALGPALPVVAVRGRPQPAGVDARVEGLVADPVAADVAQPRSQVLGAAVVAGAHTPEGHGLGVGHLEADVAVALHPAAGRDQLADDDVLLQAEEV